MWHRDLFHGPEFVLIERMLKHGYLKPNSPQGVVNGFACIVASHGNPLQHPAHPWRCVQHVAALDMFEFVVVLRVIRFNVAQRRQNPTWLAHVFTHC